MNDEKVAKSLEEMLLYIPKGVTSMRLKHTHLVVLSGLLWLGIGLLLMTKGLYFITQASGDCKMLSQLAPYVGTREQGMVLLIALALLAGLIKARTVLLKAVKKVVTRIVSLESPVSIGMIYDKRYYALMGVMMGMGLMMNWLQVPADVRGTIDVAIGSALINGAMAYFRMALTLRMTR